MAAKPFVVAPSDYAPTLDIVGEHVTVLASGEQTESSEVFLQRGPEASGPPPHSHPWDESFLVLEGQVDFGIGDESMTAAPGTFVHLPAGTVHGFRFGAGGGKMVSMTSRLAASRMFTDFAREIAPMNPDLEQLAKVGSRHGLKVVCGTILAAERIDDGTAVNLGTMERTTELRPEMPTGPSNRVANNALARQLLGWRPQVTFAEGVRRTADWYFATRDREAVRAGLTARLTNR